MQMKIILGGYMEDYLVIKSEKDGTPTLNRDKLRRIFESVRKLEATNGGNGKSHAEFWNVAAEKLITEALESLLAKMPSEEITSVQIREEIYQNSSKLPSFIGVDERIRNAAILTAEQKISVMEDYIGNLSSP
jgi:hypothetical protein